MNHSTDAAIWPLLVYIIAAVALAGVMILISHYLGERHSEEATQEQYEAGIKTTGPAHLHFSVNFYLVAMFFVIFDLETVFIVSWAVAAKDVGWAGYLGVATFILDLLVVLFYLWRVGALDFGTDGKKILKAYQKLKNANR